MKIGTSFLLNFKENISIFDFIKKSHKMGLQVVELVAEPPYCFIESIDEITRAEIKEFAKKFVIELTVHSVFSDINIAAINENMRNFSLQQIKNSIDFAVDIGAKIVTIHPGDFGAIGASYPKITQERNVKSIAELTKYASERDVIVGLENMPIMPMNQLEDAISPHNILKIVNTIDSANLRITWDVGHSHTTKYSFDEFFNSFKDHVVHFHLHDNLGPIEGWCDTHLEVGKGTINWKSFCEQISVLNTDITMVFELDTWEKIKNSFEIIKKHLN